MIRVKISTGQNSSVFSNVLLDTGSHFSLVSAQYAKKLGLRHEKLQRGDIQQIMVANSQSVAIESKVRLQINVGSLTLYEWAFCVKNLSHNVILGLKFMRNNSVNLLNDRCIAKIRGVKIPFVSGKDYLSLVVVDTPIVIPPRSSKVVFFRANAVKKNVPFKIVSLPCPTPGLVVETLPTLRNGKSCSVSRNNTVCAIRLSRNTPIGYAVRVRAPVTGDTVTSGRTERKVPLEPDRGDRDTIVGTNVPCEQCDRDRRDKASMLDSVRKLQAETPLPSNPPQAVSPVGVVQRENVRAAVLEGPLVSSNTDQSNTEFPVCDSSRVISSGVVVEKAISLDPDTPQTQRSFESLNVQRSL